MRERYALLRPSAGAAVTRHATRLQLDELTLDAAVQPRETMLGQVIAEYTALYREGHDLGPLLVYCDGGVHWLADGFHRVCAARQAGLRQLPAEVRQGDKRDAMLCACAANKHGKARTNADKRRVVLRLLTDAEWCQWSTGVIAQYCGVSREFVRQVKHQRATSLPTVGSDQKQDCIYVDRWGNTATMDTSAIGKPGPAPVTPDDIPVTAIAAAFPPVVSPPAPPTVKQLAYLQRLGDVGPPPLSLQEASQRIQTLLSDPETPPTPPQRERLEALRDQGPPPKHGRRLGAALRQSSAGRRNRSTAPWTASTSLLRRG